MTLGESGRRRFLKRVLKLGSLAPLGLAACQGRQHVDPLRCPGEQDQGGLAGAGGAQSEPAKNPATDDPFASLRGFCEGVAAPSAAEFAGRRVRVGERIARAGYAGLIVEAGVNLNYLTGVRWGQSERPLLYWIGADGQGAWVGPSFERGTLTERLQAQGLADHARLETWDEEASAFEILAKLVGKRNGAIALDPAMRVFAAQALQAAFKGQRVHASGAFVDAERMVKREAELARLRRANEATKAALRVAAKMIVLGMTETDARTIVHDAQVAAGLTGIWVLPLFGPNAAFPHGTAAQHRLTSGDLVLVDTGGSLHGYQSDITRTWAMGKANDESRRAYDAVLQAQRESLELMRAGARAGDIDAKARAVIKGAGFGDGYETFTHRLGHGIGMQGHEAPYLRMGNEQVLEAGMTMSNEPGVYLPGKLGVRIEDIVAITAEGYELFGPAAGGLEDPFGDGATVTRAGLGSFATSPARP